VFFLQDLEFLIFFSIFSSYLFVCNCRSSSSNWIDRASNNYEWVTLCLLLRALLELCFICYFIDENSISTFLFYACFLWWNKLKSVVPNFFTEVLPAFRDVLCVFYDLFFSSMHRFVQLKFDSFIFMARFDVRSSRNIDTASWEWSVKNIFGSLEWLCD
jgi:hypothetical protein